MSQLARLSLIVVATLGLLTPAPGTAQAPARSLGVVTLDPGHAPAAAVASFHLGMAALYDFAFVEARSAFADAQQQAPGFWPPLWGEAMTYFDPLLGSTQPSLARPLLDRAAQLRESAAPNSVMEALLGAALALFPDSGTTNSDAFHDAVALGLEDWPNDPDLTAFRSLVLLAEASELQGSESDRARMRAAAAIEESLAAAPAHPGLLHFLLHSYDDPVHAPLGLRAARAYAQVAPGSSHALHMPTHIYVQTGDWAEASRLNREAWNLSVASAEQFGREVLDFHALYWLLYADLQRDDRVSGQQWMETIRQHRDPAVVDNGHVHWLLMTARWVVDGDQWDERPLLTESTSVAHDLLQSTALVAQGVGAARLGEFAEVAAVADVLRSLTEKNRRDGNAAWADILSVSLGVVEGAGALTNGRVEEAVTKLSVAAEHESRLPLPNGPPTPAQPAMELLAEALLVANRPAEAIEWLERSLLRTPGRRRAATLLATAHRLDASSRRPDAGDGVAPSRQRL
ncbi:MAG: hypothetical protein GKS06_11180 [Acidobacteria bacterium]|nr:hypothetical protein [Acidobacteriota bacterium]